MSNPMNTTLPTHVKTAVENFMKYRWSHLVDPEKSRRYTGIIKALKHGGKEKQDKFVEDVAGMMKTNKEAISIAKEQTKIAEFQDRINETLQRNRT